SHRSGAAWDNPADDERQGAADRNAHAARVGHAAVRRTGPLSACAMTILFDKLRPIADRIESLGGGPLPFDTAIEAVESATEVVIAGRRTLMCGSNNYLGLSFHPEVLAAAHAALDREGAGTTGSRAANGTYAAHRQLEQLFAEV